MTPAEKLALMIAALCHDMDHPGVLTHRRRPALVVLHVPCKCAHSLPMLRCISKSGCSARHLQEGSITCMQCGGASSCCMQAGTTPT